jgi:hypothetical protein
VQRVLAEEPSGLYTPKQRFGVVVVRSFTGLPGFPGRLADYAGVEDLGIGWYSDWWRSTSPETFGGTMEYVQLLGTCTVPGYASWPPNWASVTATARANPGSVWIIGNEPEHRTQGGNTPEMYAVMYHEAYYFIKGVDPDAQIAIGGIVQPTPIRLQWLERCLAHYEKTYHEPMPVEIWNTHIQILCETCTWGAGKPVGLEDQPGTAYEIKDNFSVLKLRELIEALRTWLVAHGQGNKPLIVSEFGVLMPPSYFDPYNPCEDCGGYRSGDEAVAGFMRKSFAYFMTERDPLYGYAPDGNRLVQRWMWFSLNHPLYDEGPGFAPGGMGGALYYWDNPSQRTPLGDAYRAYVRRYTQPESLSLPLVSRGLFIAEPTATATSTATQTLTPTRRPTRTRTPTPTTSPTTSVTPTVTPSPSVTASLAASATSTPSATPTETATLELTVAPTLP